MKLSEKEKKQFLDTFENYTTDIKDYIIFDDKIMDNQSKKKIKKKDKSESFYILTDYAKIDFKNTINVESLDKEVLVKKEDKFDKNQETLVIHNHNEHNLIEVKGKIINNLASLNTNEVLYDNRIFVLAPATQQSKDENIRTFYCKNRRKNEHLKTGLYCNAILKKQKIDNTNNHIFTLKKLHSTNCNKLYEDEKKLEINTNIIYSYSDFENQCYSLLNKIETYNKKELIIKLNKLYSEEKEKNKIIFTLKDHSINDIIKNWKKNSNKFKKYNALDNAFDENGNRLLFKYETCVIYTKDKSLPISSEYFIWSCDELIARGRESRYYFIDGTWHMPKGYSQLLIILYKDIIIKEKIPLFFVLMSNRKEELYNRVFSSIIDILTQHYVYDIALTTITTDTEFALINSVKNTFLGVQRIGCWYHLKEDLVQCAHNNGLLKQNNFNKNIDPNLTKKLIYKLANICLEYDGDMKIFEDIISKLIKEYKEDYYVLIDYFVTNKKQYFIEGNYNYNLIPNDIRSNSYLERYNKEIKNYLGEKKEVNWFVFISFIKNEINRLKNILISNQNKNIRFYSK